MKFVERYTLISTIHVDIKSISSILRRNIDFLIRRKHNCRSENKRINTRAGRAIQNHREKYSSRVDTLILGLLCYRKMGGQIRLKVLQFSTFGARTFAGRDRRQLSPVRSDSNRILAIGYIQHLVTTVPRLERLVQSNVIDSSKGWLDALHSLRPVGFIVVAK